MNRGRHKKSNKEKEFYTQAEILNIIQKELCILLSIFKSRSTYNMQNYYARAYISSDDGRNYHDVIAWYINDTYYLDDFISKVEIELNRETIKNKIYLIKFDFGSNSKTFKYKHV